MIWVAMQLYIYVQEEEYILVMTTIPNLLKYNQSLFTCSNDVQNRFYITNVLLRKLSKYSSNVNNKCFSTQEF